MPTVLDNCNRTITPSAPVVGTDPVCAGTKTYTYTYTDCAGVAKTWTYTYTISAPTFTLPADGSSTVACVADAVAPTVPVVQIIAEERSHHQHLLLVQILLCAGTKTYTYTYTDCAGVAKTWIYTYTISAPTFTLPADGSSTVACLADAVAPTVPVVTDNCGRTITPSAPVVGTDPLCAGTKTYTYTYTDCAGVAKTWIYTYTISAPTFTLPADGSSTVACLADAVAPTPPTVLDNCNRTITPSAPVVGTDPVCAGTKTYTYTYTDCAGVAKTWIYTYTITAPTFTLPADGSSTVACLADAVAPTVPAVTDNCGQNDHTISACCWYRSCCVQEPRHIHIPILTVQE